MGKVAIIPLDQLTLTEKQKKYLHGGLCVTMTDREGWIFVEQKKYAGEEGSGVWVDPQGKEHYGPTG